MGNNTLNTQTCIGRLGRDPEMKQGKTPFLPFSLAYEVWVDGANKTEWQDVVVFGKSAEFLAKYAKKSDLIYIQGDVRINRWKDKTSGLDREKSVINAREAKILSNGKGGSKAHSDSVPADSPAPPPRTQDAYDDDIPF